MPRRYVAVCGASDATASQLKAAREVGRLLAEAGVVVINGGLGGVSGAARQGASPHLTISLPTGMGQARNVLIVTAAESVIAIGEGWGTLSEIAVARRIGRPVVALDSWSVKGLETVTAPADAVRLALG